MCSKRCAAGWQVAVLPPVRCSPCVLVTGSGSPVRADSSTVLRPPTTTCSGWQRYACNDDQNYNQCTGPRSAAQSLAQLTVSSHRQAGRQAGWQAGRQAGG